MKLDEVITNLVNNHQGIRATELVLATMSVMGPVNFTHDEYSTAVESLVQAKEIVELEYILPQMDYRVKSIYFPKNTRIIVNEGTVNNGC